jgi:hypothetical protein
MRRRKFITLLGGAASPACDVLDSSFHRPRRRVNCPCPGALIDYLHQMQGDLVVSGSASVCSEIHQEGFDGYWASKLDHPTCIRSGCS